MTSFPVPVATERFHAPRRPAEPMGPVSAVDLRFLPRLQSRTRTGFFWNDYSWVVGLHIASALSPLKSQSSTPDSAARSASPGACIRPPQPPITYFLDATAHRVIWRCELPTSSIVASSVEKTGIAGTFWPELRLRTPRTKGFKADFTNSGPLLKTLGHRSRLRRWRDCGGRTLRVGSGSGFGFRRLGLKPEPLGA